MQKKGKNLPYSSVLEQGYQSKLTKSCFMVNSLCSMGCFGKPKAEKNRHNHSPLVIFIHGGCWLNAFDISHSQALDQCALSDQGLTQSGQLSIDAPAMKEGAGLAHMKIY